MAESKTPKKTDSKTDVKSESPKLIKMMHPDGRVAFPSESMIHAYKSSGYKEA
mgnify:CR=1 FL=1